MSHQQQFGTVYDNLSLRNSYFLTETFTPICELYPVTIGQVSLFVCFFLSFYRKDYNLLQV